MQVAPTPKIHIDHCDGVLRNGLNFIGYKVQETDSATVEIEIGAISKEQPRTITFVLKCDGFIYMESGGDSVRIMRAETDPDNIPF